MPGRETAYAWRVSDAIADLLQPGWTAQPLDHNPLNAATGGIWRVRRDDGTAILKILWPGGTVNGRADWATSDDPGHWNYWRREGLAYRTGLCAAAFAAGGIRPPVLLDAVDRYDGSVALWLEDVRGTPGPELTTPQYADLAYRLGVAHAAWLAGTGQAAWPGPPAAARRRRATSAPMPSIPAASMVPFETLPRAALQPCPTPKERW